MNMTISTYNSHKISVLNMVLIFLVILIHNYYSAEEMPVVSAVQSFAGTNGIARVAVPMFFLLSGILFYNGVQTLKDIFWKIKKRIRSLFVPYILWNIIFVLWYVLLQNMPGINGMVNTDVVDKIFGGTMVSGIKELWWAPAAFQLWFLRDLIVIILFSPLLYFLIHHFRWITPLLTLGVMFLLVKVGLFSAIDYDLNRIDGVFFFCIGGCISLCATLESVDRALSVPVTCIAGVVFIGNAVWQIFGTDFNNLYNTTTALCGCIVVWKVYDYLADKNNFDSNAKLKPNKYLGYSFFIYLFHEPTLNIIKKISLKLLGEHEWSLILLYFVNPILMCIIAIAIAKILQRYTPQVYRVLVGGR